MENLEKALSERLRKAKYLKRTGGPGHYKYQYKKGVTQAARGGFAGAQTGIGKIKKEEDRKGPKQAMRGGFAGVQVGKKGEHISGKKKKVINRNKLIEKLKDSGYSTDAAESGAELHIGAGISINTIDNMETDHVDIVAQMFSDDFITSSEVKKLVKDYDKAGKRYDKYVEKEEKGEEKSEGEDYSEFETSELVGEFQQSMGEQDLINYVAKKTKVSSSEIEQNDVLEYTKNMSRKQLLKELE